MRNPFDNFGKKTVREAWNTPLLRFLNSEYGFRYRYVGLPGVKIIDLLLWQELIDEVVAFEARATYQRDDAQGRRNISALRRNLHSYGFNARTYFGSMEEVVIMRRDQDGKPYSQSNLVTLYNLDFCNEIASPVETQEEGKQVWRFHAIRQILHDQWESYNPGKHSGYFVILLTVRDQIDANKLRAHFSEPFADSKDYWDSCQQVRPLPETNFILGEHSWSLKTFIHDQMRKWFVSPHISALFFPLVKYSGAPVKTRDAGLLPSPMLHMMILCRFGDLTQATPLFLPPEFLTTVACVRARDDGGLAWDPEPGEPQVAVGTPDPQDWFLQHRDNLIRDPRTGITKVPG